MSLRTSLRRSACALALLAGCGGDDTASHAEATAAAELAAQQTHIREVVASGGIVDSILPVAEQLRRFQSPLTPVDSLRAGSVSIAQLLGRLTDALAARDTAALNAMTLSRAEFAFLYYPGSAMSLPPYEAPPELLWGQIMASSNAGASKLLERFGGAKVVADSLHCLTKTMEGANTLHERCSVRFTGNGRTMTGNLFGTIIERDGRYKFLSLANRI